MSKWQYSRRAGVIVAAVGLLMMVFGMFRGEIDTVFIKAINICMECIGIG